MAHYRTVGPPIELPSTLEDLAVVLAQCEYENDARAALDEAVGLYEDLQARWDMRRAESRFAPRFRRRVRVRRPEPPRSGWEALTPTEVKIAALVATGDSTSDIARSLFLSRRTVQTYISHILAKLGANSRVDIVREALSRRVALAGGGVSACHSPGQPVNPVSGEVSSLDHCFRPGSSGFALRVAIADPFRNRGKAVSGLRAKVWVCPDGCRRNAGRHG